MSKWWARALTERPTESFTAYAWSDHTGWHMEPTLSATTIPVGTIWAWGPSTWAYWREDRTHPIEGILLREADSQPAGDWTPALVHRINPGKDVLPSSHSEPRFFRSDDADAASWRRRPAVILRVMEPARVDLVEVCSHK